MIIKKIKYHYYLGTDKKNICVKYLRVTGMTF